MNALIIAEHNNNLLATATIAAINMASLLTDNLTILIVGYHCQSVVNQSAILNKVTRVLYLDDYNFQHLIAENLTNVVIDLINQHYKVRDDDKKYINYDFIITAATKFGKNLLPRIAGKLNVEQVSEVTKVISPDTFERTICSGNAIENVKIDCKIKCLTIRAINFNNDFIENNCSADIIKLDAKNYLIDPRICFFKHTTYMGSSHEHQKSENTRLNKVQNNNQICYNQELTTAKIVVAGGGALGSKENFALVEQFAIELNAAVGASKFAVDAGFAPNHVQIGQTGKVIAPYLYIAVGISGAIQHLAGIKGSKIIIAINKDENAPIVKMANYSIIGDLFKIIPEILTELKRLKILAAEPLMNCEPIN